jgi:hypothetical protein
MTTLATPCGLQAFQSGAIDPAHFPHAEHVRVGYEMLTHHSFGDTISRFSRGLKLLAAKAGKPGIYHETITVAFLAVINERRAGNPTGSWSEFRANNPDLFDKRCLEKWYAAEQLESELARQTFCLPKPLRTPPGQQPVSLASRGTRRRGATRRSRAAPG